MSDYITAIKAITRELTVTAKRICGPSYDVVMNTKLREEDMRILQGSDRSELYNELFGGIQQEPGVQSLKP